MGIRITLEWYEYSIAAEVGKLRTMTAIRHGIPSKYGASSNAWTDDIEGAAAEMAVAKYLGVYWGGSMETFKAADISEKIQVRQTKYESGRLIVRSEDRDDHVYVLVTGTIPNLTIHGWIEGSEAKQDIYLDSPNDRPPAYFIPQSQLQPVEMLQTLTGTRSSN